MVGHLERNERVVSWLQPEGAGVEQQVPAVRVRGVYYTLSLRMMKSIWRHVGVPLLVFSFSACVASVTGGEQVRLRKGFVNVENAPYGGRKLRIPSQLFTEKMRTQTRFNVCARFRVYVPVLVGLVYSSY